MMEFVIDLLREKLSEYEIEVQNGNADSHAFHEKQVKSLEKKLADIASKELALWEAQLDPEHRMPKHVHQSLTDKLLKEREDTEAALSNTRKLLSEPINNEIKRVTLQKTLEALKDDNVSAAEKNRFLKACISRITYHREPAQRMLGKGNGRGYISAPIELDVKMML